MANAIIRAAVIRVASRKIAEAHSGQLSVTTGDEATFGADGYFTHSTGATQSKLTIKALIPVAGMQKDLTDIVINKKRVNVTYLAGGKEYQIANAAATQFEIDSETKTGVLEGSFTFEGGPPTVVG